MNHVLIRYYPIGKTKLQDVTPAVPLSDECETLSSAFRKSLLESPRGFNYSVELEGFPLIEVKWAPSCPTAGALIFKSFQPTQPPDLVAVLLNGVETADEIAGFISRYPLRPDIWEQTAKAPKPLAVAAVFTVGRIREPATITILNTFANVFFAQFGTNAGA